MKFATIFATVAAAFVGVALAEEEAVVTLTTDNFDKFIEEHPISLVKFHAPWCGHCKRLAPEFEKAAKALAEQGIDVPLAKVDATVETALGERFQIRGYPTLKFFKNGQESEYDGGRTDATIVSWIKKNTGPAVNTVANNDAAKTEAAKESVAFVGAFASEESEEYKTFQAIADVSRDAGAFFAYFGQDTPSVTVYRESEEPTSTNDLSKDALTKFVKDESFHLFTSISGDNFSRYMDRGLDLVWAVLSEDDFNTYANNFREVAKTVRSEYSMVWLDTARFAAHAEGALGVTDFPAVVIQKKAGRFVYPSKEMTVEGLTKFFSDVAEGKIARSIKSEPVPTENDGPVKTVVADNFEEIVFAEGKDVLLEVYAPWCGHCKRLEPIYNELGEKLVESKVDHIVIAKMDGTANESPVENFDWTGFPTIFWIPAGEKTPTKYNGGRTVEAMLDFLKKKASQPLVLSEAAEGSGENKKDEL